MIAWHWKVVLATTIDLTAITSAGTTTTTTTTTTSYLREKSLLNFNSRELKLLNESDLNKSFFEGLEQSQFAGSAERWEVGQDGHD